MATAAKKAEKEPKKAVAKKATVKKAAPAKKAVAAPAGPGVDRTEV